MKYQIWNEEQSQKGPNVTGASMAYQGHIAGTRASPSGTIRVRRDEFKVRTHLGFYIK